MAPASVRTDAEERRALSVLSSPSPDSSALSPLDVGEPELEGEPEEEGEPPDEVAGAAIDSSQLLSEKKRVNEDVLPGSLTSKEALSA